MHARHDATFNFAVRWSIVCLCECTLLRERAVVFVIFKHYSFRLGRRATSLAIIPHSQRIYKLIHPFLGNTCSWNVFCLVLGFSRGCGVLSVFHAANLEQADRQSSNPSFIQSPFIPLPSFSFVILTFGSKNVLFLKSLPLALSSFLPFLALASSALPVPDSAPHLCFCFCVSWRVAVVAALAYYFRRLSRFVNTHPTYGDPSCFCSYRSLFSVTGTWFLH